MKHQLSQDRKNEYFIRCEHKVGTTCKFLNCKNAHLIKEIWMTNNCSCKCYFKVLMDFSELSGFVTSCFIHKSALGNVCLFVCSRVRIRCEPSGPLSSLFQTIVTVFSETYALVAQLGRAPTIYLDTLCESPEI